MVMAMPNQMDTSIMGSIIDNYTETVLVALTQATLTITVPADRRWWVTSGMFENGDTVTRNMRLDIYNASAQRIGIIHAPGNVSAAGLRHWPSRNPVDTNMSPSRFPMKAGDYITVTWAAPGSGAGGTSRTTVLGQEVLV